MQIPEKVINFLEKQGFVIVATLDKNNFIHTSCKGIVGIEEDKIYLIDLYQGNTFLNLKRIPYLNITAVDEDQFVGFSLKGHAKLIERDKIKNKIIATWEEKLLKRISKRLIRNIKEEKKSFHHEINFPRPKYLIVVEVLEIIDLTKPIVFNNAKK